MRLGLICTRHGRNLYSLCYQEGVWCTSGHSNIIHCFSSPARILWRHPLPTSLFTPAEILSQNKFEVWEKLCTHHVSCSLLTIKGQTCTGSGTQRDYVQLSGWCSLELHLLVLTNVIMITCLHPGAPMMAMRNSELCWSGLSYLGPRHSLSLITILCT